MTSMIAMQMAFLQSRQSYLSLRAACWEEALFTLHLGIKRSRHRTQIMTQRKRPLRLHWLNREPTFHWRSDPHQERPSKALLKQLTVKPIFEWKFTNLPPRRRT